MSAKITPFLEDKANLMAAGDQVAGTSHVNILLQRVLEREYVF